MGAVCLEAWAHYPSDVLVGAALGNFTAPFFTEAFLGLKPGAKSALGAEPTRGAPWCAGTTASQLTLGRCQVLQDCKICMTPRQCQQELPQLGACATVREAQVVVALTEDGSVVTDPGR